MWTVRVALKRNGTPSWESETQEYRLQAAEVGSRVGALVTDLLTRLDDGGTFRIGLSESGSGFNYMIHGNAERASLGRSS